MKRTAELKDGKTVTLECNAATAFLGKKIFNTDYLKFFQSVSELEISDQIEKLQTLAFVMAKQAEMPWRDVLELKEDDFIDWLSQFDFSEMTDKIVSTAMDLWNFTEQPASKPKN